MIALAPPSRRSVLRAIAPGAGAPVRWVYLGDSVRTMRKVARWLGPESQRISIAESLQGTAASQRTPYIDFVGKLGVEQEAADWWFSSLSEKNLGISKAFLHICYVEVALNLCRQHADSGTLLFVAESQGVRSAIAGYLRDHAMRFVQVRESFLRSGARGGRGWAEMLVRKAWSAGRHVYRMIVARALGFSAGVFHEAAATESQPWALLHNWVDPRSFDADGRYRDVFFGPLREELQRRGVPVAIVASVLYKAPYLRLLFRLRRAGIPVLVPHAALTLRDLLKWSRCLWPRPSGRRLWPRFEGFDVSEILAEDEGIDRVNTRHADVLLISTIVRRWSRYVKASVFIYTYEGHTWERGYCRAFREHFAGTRLVGYQHSTFSPMWLNHFVSKSELQKVPLPDRIVTNGPYHYELLRTNGVPEHILACGGALRYSALGGGVSVPPAGRAEGLPVKILAAFSIFPTQAAELLWAVTEAFAHQSQFRVLLKFHPTLRASHAARAGGFSLRSLPAHIQVVDRPVSQLLPEADVLVYTDTTTAIEALAYGVPVVHLLSGHAIDKDRLASFPGTRVSTGTPEGLREAVHAVVKVGPEEHAARSRRWREVVDLLLPPPDEKTIDLFMPENVR